MEMQQVEQVSVLISKRKRATSHGARKGNTNMGAPVGKEMNRPGCGAGHTLEGRRRPGQQAWASPGSWLAAAGPVAWAAGLGLAWQLAWA